MKLVIKRLGHDSKGYMITDNDTLEIISRHRTKANAIKRLNSIKKLNRNKKVKRGEK